MNKEKEAIKQLNSLKAFEIMRVYKQNALIYEALDVAIKALQEREKRLRLIEYYKKEADIPGTESYIHAYICALEKCESN